MSQKPVVLPSSVTPKYNIHGQAAAHNAYGNGNLKNTVKLADQPIINTRPISNDSPFAFSVPLVNASNADPGV